MLRTLLLAAALLTGCTVTLPTSTATREIPEPQAILQMRRGSYTLDDGTSVAGPPEAALPALLDALQARRQSLQAEAARDPSKEPFRGTLRVEAEPAADASDLVRILEGIGAAGWADPWLAVSGADGQPRGIQVALRVADAGRVAAATASTPDRTAGGYVNPRLHLDPGRGVRVRAFDRTVDPGDGLWLPCASTPCGDRWPHVELNRLARRLKLDHRRDRAVLMSALPGVRVQDLVDALDHTRDDTPTAAGSREVFPVAILSSAEAL